MHHFMRLHCPGWILFNSSPVTCHPYVIQWSVYSVQRRSTDFDLFACAESVHKWKLISGFILPGHSFLHFLSQDLPPQKVLHKTASVLRTLPDHTGNIGAGTVQRVLEQSYHHIAAVQCHRQQTIPNSKFSPEFSLQ